MRRPGTGTGGGFGDTIGERFRGSSGGCAVMRLGVWLLGLLLVVGCSGSNAPAGAGSAARPSPMAADTGAAAGGTLRWGISEPSAITPAEVVDPSGLLVVDALFDSLTSHGPGLEVIPAAADRWEPAAGGAVWRFTLREGSTFHDGSPVTAADFALAWDRAVAGGRVGYHLSEVLGYDDVVAGRAQHLAGVVKVDDRTLEVRLRAPYADFPAVVGHPALGPLPRGALDRAGADFARNPVGNGPFRAAEPWAAGRFIRLRRFEQWRPPPGVAGRPPVLDEVVFQILDPDDAYVAFQQGRLDVAPIPPGALDTALEHYGPAPGGYRGPGILLGGESSLYLLALDLDVPPFDDVDVRRAVSMALNRSKMAQATLEGNVRASRSLVPLTIPGARGQSCEACRYAPEAARGLFAAHGVAELPLWFNAGASHEPVMNLVAADMAAIGVRVTPTVVEFPEYLDAVRSDRAGMFRFGWIADYPTLDNMLYPLLHSAGRGNLAGFADPEIDALLDQARATLDARTRRDLYRRVEELALDEHQVLVPLFTFRHRLAVSERVEGFMLDPLGRANLSAVTVADPQPKPGPPAERHPTAAHRASAPPETSRMTASRAGGDGAPMV